MIRQKVFRGWEWMSSSSSSFWWFAKNSLNFLALCKTASLFWPTKSLLLFRRIQDFIMWLEWKYDATAAVQSSILMWSSYSLLNLELFTLEIKPSIVLSFAMSEFKGEKSIEFLHIIRLRGISVRIYKFLNSLCVCDEEAFSYFDISPLSSNGRRLPSSFVARGC